MIPSPARSALRGLVSAAFVVGAAMALGAAGCELIVPFDRSEIPLGDAGADATTDAEGDSSPEGSPEDSAVARDSTAAETGTVADTSTTEDSATTEDTSTGEDSSMPEDSATTEDSASHDSGTMEDSSTLADSAMAADTSMASDTSTEVDSSTADGAAADASDGGPTCEAGATRCSSPSQCTASPTTCVVDTCTSGCCSTVNASAGTTCSDNGGVVCDGNGNCVKLAQGQTCTSNTQCLSNSCVDGFCCSSACTSTCMACSLSLTGSANGTCANIRAGTAAPTGQCAVTTTCGNDGNCDGSGACEQASSSVSCSTASCNGGVYTPAATCTGTGSCGASPQTCTAACDPAVGCVQCTTGTECTTPPGPFGCFDVTHLYTPACTTDTCQYTAGTACTNGCWQDVCNTTGPSYDGDATGPAGGSLDEEANFDASNGSEAAGTPITVNVSLTPHNAVSSVTLEYTTDDFNTVTPVTCVLNGTAGNDDVWTATIPGQAAATTVRFYYASVPYNGSGDIYLPGNDVNYTYVTH